MELMRKEKCIMEQNDYVFLPASQEQHNEEQEQPKKRFSLDYEDNDDEKIIYADEIEKWAKTKLQTIKDLDEFPTVKKIFLKYNTALASQASVERVFSYAKLVFGLQRRRLDDENFEKQLVLKANRKLNPKLFLKRD